jgi:PAS domain S-box-containing protein
MSDERLQHSVEEMYEAAPCGFLLTLMDGTIVRMNRTLRAWIGRSREDLERAKRFQDLLTLPGRIFYENQFFPLLRMQGTIREVALDLSRDGREPLPVLINSTVQNDEQGEPAFIASAILDATDRRAYERELLRSQRRAEQLAAVVRMSSDAIVSMSPDGVVQTWNHGAERLFGYATHDAVGMNLRSVLPDSMNGDAWQSLIGEVRAGRSVNQDMTGVRSDGETVDVSAGFTPHWGPVGELLAVSVIMRDIVHRRQLERLQQEFIALATHELRSPVTGIKGNAQLMQRRAAYSERSVEAIIAQAGKLQRLIDDLMLASQIQADRFTVLPDVIDLVDAARLAVTLVGEEEAAIRVETSHEPIFVSADSHRLNQVLTNLLTNALKYSPDRADVLVRVSHEANEARVSVIDHGVGISAEALPFLFDRFYRAAGAAHQAQGLGLGLYISQRIIEAHGGRIDVESEVGKGSTFTVVLPMLAG